MCMEGTATLHTHTHVAACNRKSTTNEMDDNNSAYGERWNENTAQSQRQQARPPYLRMFRFRCKSELKCWFSLSHRVGQQTALDSSALTDGPTKSHGNREISICSHRFSLCLSVCLSPSGSNHSAVSSIAIFKCPQWQRVCVFVPPHQQHYFHMLCSVLGCSSERNKFRAIC